NRKGFERASSFTQLDLEGAAMVALSESFLLKNNNRTHSQAIEEVVEFAELFKVSGLSFERLMVSTCFGDEDEGRKDEKDVVTLLERVFHRLADAGLSFPEEITYADTTGWGNPRAVEKLIDASRSLFPQQQIGFHFHDTRGLGLANVYAALRLGIDRFDSSV